MPTCRVCRGTGQVEVRIPIMVRCPDCDGTKRLPDGTECKRCNKWGEIESGESKSETKLCTTCMGSGQVSEGSVTVWFLVRAIPAALVLLGGGSAAAWGSWSYLGNTLVTSLIIIIFFGGWGGIIAYLLGQMPRLGEISVTNWFLIRSIPTTLVALAVGGAVVWSSWVYLKNAPITTILILAAFGIWGAFMFYFISHLPD